jgi:thioredoxin 2
MSEQALGTTPKVVVCPNCQKKNRVQGVSRGVPRCAVCHTNLPWVVDATDRDFASVAEEPTISVLVDIWAPWCGPCRMVSPALEQLAAELAGELKLVKVNADDSPQLSRRFDVQAIPTLLLLKGGRVIDRQVGAAPLPTLRSWVKDTLKGGMP